MVGAPHWEPARGAPTMPTSGVSGQGDGDADTAGEGDRGDGDVVPTGASIDSSSSASSSVFFLMFLAMVFLSVWRG